MKKTFLKNGFICILFALSASFAHAQDWTKYQSAEMKFGILFPQQPTEQQQSTPTAVGSITLHMVMADLTQDASASNMFYMVNYSVFPDSISSDRQDKSDVFFEGAINGMVKNVSGTLLSTKNITYKNFPGREAKVEVEGQGVITAHAILIHNRFYILMVISGKGKDTNPDVTKFFDSFESGE